jgi:rhomboid protease GluP
MTGERRPVQWLTYLLIAANLAMFGVELARGASAVSPDPKIIIDLGANYAPLTLTGQWWRLVTSMFLHFGVIHIGMNMLCLYQARATEDIFGRVGYAAIYFSSGLLGSVASLARAWSSPPAPRARSSASTAPSSRSSWSAAPGSIPPPGRG